MSTHTQSSFGGARKAAILLSVLNEAEAVPILRSLPPSDLERVTDELANLPRIPAELTLPVLEEYKQMMASRGSVTVGGQDVAVRLLVKAFGENGAESMVQRLNRPKDNNSLDLDLLRKTEPQQVARFLAGEHAQTKALLLGHLEPKQASALLMQLEPEDRVDCVKRMATMGQFSSEAAAKASQVIKRRFSFAGETDTDEARRYRLQKSCRLDESAGAVCCERNSGNIRIYRTGAGQRYPQSDVHIREFPRCART